jgi:L-aspartate oxidase
VGIVRSNHHLKQALREVEILRKAVAELFSGSRITPELLELRNTTLVGWLIIACALRRKESRGLNYNVDYPERDDAHCRVDTVLDPQAV